MSSSPFLVSFFPYPYLPPLLSSSSVLPAPIPFLPLIPLLPATQRLLGSLGLRTFLFNWFVTFGCKPTHAAQYTKASTATVTRTNPICCCRFAPSVLGLREDSESEDGKAGCTEGEAKSANRKSQAGSHRASQAGSRRQSHEGSRR